MRSEPSPDFKGIKTVLQRLNAAADDGSEPSPDFKGIKTLDRIRRWLLPWSEPSPDFKGIKTQPAVSVLSGLRRPNQALISKGLRLQTTVRLRTPNTVRTKP
ncbi:hypothetical protein [Tepidimonas sp.]|uniref:hypothetical protein n=1 Tax=Tepidimonas sp. TaxID=2002775 RepID=UPI00391DB651